MTLSMLRGESGRQAAELQRLVDWLAGAGFRADVVHLSNALLLGMAAELKRRLGAAAVCSLQDEDVWVDAMRPGKAREVWDLMAAKARDVDAFTAVSRCYADAMGPRLGIPPARLQVVPAGIELAGHRPAPLTFDPPTIGFLSRLARSEGLPLLAEAFLILKQDRRLAPLKLAATGGQTGDDHRMLREVQRRLRRAGVLADFAVQPAFDRPRRLEFLQSLSLISVPVLKGDACGMYLLEALASGVPFVQPRLGAFPEIFEATRGGLLYDRQDPPALAAALAELLLDPARARQLAARGREAVLQKFSAEEAARRLADVYASLRTRREGSRS
jgi:glycosyltransferase involved in cell wall biosynthesis